MTNIKTHDKIDIQDNLTKTMAELYIRMSEELKQKIRRQVQKKKKENISKYVRELIEEDIEKK